MNSKVVTTQQLTHLWYKRLSQMGLPLDLLDRFTTSKAENYWLLRLVYNHPELGEFEWWVRHFNIAPHKFVSMVLNKLYEADIKQDIALRYTDLEWYDIYKNSKTVLPKDQFFSVFMRRVIHPTLKMCVLVDADNFFNYLQLGLDGKEFKELVNIILKEHKVDLLRLIDADCVYTHTHEHLSTLEGFLKKQFNEDFGGEIL